MITAAPKTLENTQRTAYAKPEISLKGTDISLITDVLEQS